MNTLSAIISQLMRMPTPQAPRMAMPRPASPFDVPRSPDPRDLRPDGTMKGAGYFGALKRPDGGVSSELSASFDDVLGGADIPLLVPTLTPDEIQMLLSAPMNGQLPRSIIDKAIAFAKERVASGGSPFASEYEQDTRRYPQFDRVPTLRGPRDE